MIVGGLTLVLCAVVRGEVSQGVLFSVYGVDGRDVGEW